MKSKVLKIIAAIALTSSFAQGASTVRGASVSVKFDVIPWSSITIQGEPAKSLFSEMAKTLPVRESNEYRVINGAQISCFNMALEYGCSITVRHTDGLVETGEIYEGDPRMGAGN